MFHHRSRPVFSSATGRSWGGRAIVAAWALAAAAALSTPGVGGQGVATSGARYYSTAEAPRDYVGRAPTLTVALVDPAAVRSPEGELGVPPKAIDTKPRPPAPASPRVASAAINTRIPLDKPAPATPRAAVDDPIARAKKAIADCKEHYRNVQDYTCTFLKRERIDGRLNGQHVMQMKARSSPLSIYFKFQKPNRGREAIYVAGRQGGRILAHDVGIGKFLAGTMKLDPRGSMAMEDNLHPITEAGIGGLIETVSKHWAVELTPEESVLTFHPNMQVGGRPCTMIESVHPRRRPNFLFHKVKLYVDHEHGLPIRFEGYDWPRHAAANPELVEEYTYLNLRTNVGLSEADFDPTNAQYSFGRF